MAIAEASIRAPTASSSSRRRRRKAWRSCAPTRERSSRSSSREFFSVTFGAGGSTRERTLGTVLEIRAGGHAAAPHLSCIGSTRADIRATLEHYKSHGIRHSSRCAATCRRAPRRCGEFRYANELVEFIRGDTPATGSHRGRRATRNSIRRRARRSDDLRELQAQGRGRRGLGDHAVLLQRRRYFRFVDECEALGIDLPIVPGHHADRQLLQLARFSDACGAEIPRWIRRKLEELRRRRRVDPRVRARRGHRPVRPPAAQRRARAALLHAEPGRPHHHDLAAARALGHPA